MQVVIELSDETYKGIKEENGIYGINNGLSVKITGKVVGAIQSGTPLPKGTTNGEMIKAMFNISDSEIDEGLSTTYIYTKTRVLKGGSQDRLREQITFDREWWNAPYKGSEGE